MEGPELQTERQFPGDPAANIEVGERRAVETLTLDLSRPGAPEHIQDPGGDRLDQHLCALVLEEAEHAEVAVTFSGLCPEFADHLDDRLDAQSIDLDVVQAIAGGGKRLARLQAVQVIMDLAEGAQSAAELLPITQPLDQPGGACSSISNGRRFRMALVRASVTSPKTRSVSPAWTSKGRI